MGTEDGIAIAGSEAQRDEEFPGLEIPGIRRRLFTVLAWAAGGFVAIAALSMVLGSVFDHLLPDIGFRAAALCVGAGLGGFVLTVAIANGLDEGRRVAAQVWCCVYVGRRHAERAVGESDLAVYPAHRYAVFVRRIVGPSATVLG